MEVLGRFARVDEVVNEVVKYLHLPPSCTLDLLHALGKVSSCTITCSKPIPPHLKATMDGVAVKSSDVAHASEVNPIYLKLRSNEVVHACEQPNFELREGECVLIETGGYLPRGADAVVRLEDVEVADGTVAVYRSVPKYGNVSLVGEELSTGDTIVSVGDVIRPWHLAALSSQGLSSIEVYDLKCGVVITGDEFVRGLAIPYTMWLIVGWLRENWFTEVTTCVVPDDTSTIVSKVKEFISRNYPVILIVGGTALGRKDYSVKAIKLLGPEYMVHGLAIRPGRTTCVSAVDGRLVIAMSGLPVAALAVLELILRSILIKWLGVRAPPRAVVRGKLVKKVAGAVGYRCFVRVIVRRISSEYFIEPIMVGGSGSLRSLVLGNGYLVVPEDVEGYDVGDVVEVTLYGHVEEGLSQTS